MNQSQIYVLITIVILAIVAAVLFFIRKDKQGEKLSPLAGLSLVYVVTGIIFGDDRFTAYSLMGVGVLLAVIDVLNKRNRKKPAPHRNLC